MAEITLDLKDLDLIEWIQADIRHNMHVRWYVFEYWHDYPINARLEMKVVDRKTGVELSPELVTEYDDPSLKMTKRYPGYIRYYNTFLLILKTVFLDLNTGFPNAKTLYVYPVSWGDGNVEIKTCGTIRFNAQYNKYMFEPTSKSYGCIYIDAYTASQLTKVYDMRQEFCNALIKGKVLRDYEHKWLSAIITRAGLCKETTGDRDCHNP